MKLLRALWHGGVAARTGLLLLAVLFSAGMLINSVFSASMLQSHTVGRALLASYDLNPYVVSWAVGMAITIL